MLHLIQKIVIKFNTYLIKNITNQKNFKYFAKVFLSKKSFSIFLLINCVKEYGCDSNFFRAYLYMG